MPGFTTHYLFGLHYYKQLKDTSIKNLISSHHEVFSLGLQGPDVFFYYLPSYLIHDKNIGSLAHTQRTGLFLRHLIESRNLITGQTQTQIAQTYIMGFMGHYILDCACHPYVYYRTHYHEDTPRYFGRHVNLETAIDSALLEYAKQMLPSRFHQEDTIRLSQLQQRTVASILHDVYSRTYPGLPHAGYPTMWLAIRSLQWGTRLLRDPSGIKKAVIRRAEALYPGYPVLSPMVSGDSPSPYVNLLNLSHRKWHNPWDKTLTSTASFPDLMAEASGQYGHILDMLGRMYGCRKGSAEEQHWEKMILEKLGNRSYHNGLPPAPPLFTKRHPILSLDSANSVHSSVV